MQNRFQNLILRLEQSGVKYTCVGGYAVMLRGSSMMTKDVAICIDLSSGHLERLYEALKDLNPIHRMGTVKRPFASCGSSKNRVKAG